MEAYVDYEFYADIYEGKLEEDDFFGSVIKATSHVRRITFGRADFYVDGDEVKLATCAVCDVIAAEEKKRDANNGMPVSSENTDGYSVSYVSELESGESAEELLNRKAYKAAEVFLSPTGLLDWWV